MKSHNSSSSELEDFINKLRESVAPAEFLLSQVVLLTGCARTDVLSITEFEKHPSRSQAMELSWSVLRPETFVLKSKDLPSEPAENYPPLPDNVEMGILQQLVKFEEERRVPYQPDEDIWAIDEDLFIYIHVAGALAFRLKTKDGYSDEVRHMLGNIRQTMYRLDEGSKDPSRFCIEAPVWYISTAAITGLTLVELSRISRLDANYGEALHLLTQSLQYYGGAVINREQPTEDFSPEIAGEEGLWQERLEGYFSPLHVDPQEAANTFEQLRSNGRGIDWKQVAEDCNVLAEWWSECLRDNDEIVADAQGRKWEWLQFWYVAQGWAEAKMSPSESRDFHNEGEDRAAKKRLTTYFFDRRLLETMPERAQRSLIDAERALFDTTVGRIESALADLQVATESICYSLIGKHPKSSKGKPSPSLGDYVDEFRKLFFLANVPGLKLNHTDRQFLQKELPNALECLRDLRNEAEHDPTRKWRKEEVTRVLKEFLGIGRPGILPRLLEILKPKS